MQGMQLPPNAGFTGSAWDPRGGGWLSVAVRSAHLRSERALCMASQPEKDAVPSRPELGEACPLSEAQRRRLFIDEYEFLGREADAACQRQIHLRRLINVEYFMHPYGFTRTAAQVESWACPYFWTERARQLLHASEEERLRFRDLLDQQMRLKKGLEDASGCRIVRDPSTGEWEWIPGSWAEYRRAREAGSEQDFGAAAHEAYLAAMVIELEAYGCMYPRHRNRRQVPPAVPALAPPPRALAADFDGTLAPCTEANRAPLALLESARHMRLRAPRSVRPQECAA